MALVDPFRQAELDRIQVLDSLFPPEIKLSNDLRQIILDYVFPRIVYDNGEGEKRYWARFGVFLLNGKYCYEIRVYNNNFSETISTFDITKSEFALGHFKRLDGYDWQDFLVRLHWTSVYQYYSDSFTYYLRHLFCPTDGKTYRLELVKHENHNKTLITVLEIPKSKEIQRVVYWGFNRRVIMVFDDYNQGLEKFYECQDLVIRNGGDWTKYPEVGADVKKDFEDGYKWKSYYLSKDDVFEE